MTYRDVTPAWTRGEFRAAARKRYGVFEREGEEVKVETRKETTETGRSRRIVNIGRRAT